MGRMSWNQSYRLENIINLYKLTTNVNLKKQIEKIVEILLRLDNTYHNLDNVYNSKFSYSSKKYSLDKSTPISLMVTDAQVYYSMLLAVNTLEGSLINQYTLTLEEKLSYLFDYYENNYDDSKKMYKFQYGTDFIFDGIILPFNQQNIFGLVLLELYKMTGEEKYKNRSFELAQKFKSEFVYSDNKLLWHYWPNEFYLGWNSDDNLSVNTLSRTQRDDVLFEDLSHASLNLKFILEFQNSFPNEIFLDSDIVKISNTIDGFIYDKEFSKFTSGDIAYQEQNYRFIPSVSWGRLGNENLNKFYINLNPIFYPDFDQQNWNKYLETIDKTLLYEENIKIENYRFDIDANIISVDVNSYNHLSINNYFEE